MLRTKRTATIVAASVADIASLSKLDFDNILVQFPDFAASIESHFHKWVLHCQACCFGLGGFW
jgi:hypothetical protein